MKRIVTLLGLLLLTLFTRCNTGEQPVSAAEAQQTAAALISSAERKDATFLNNMIELSTFCKRVEQNMHTPLSRDEERGIATALLSKDRGIGMITGYGTNSSFKLLRRYSKAGKQHLLFRVYMDGGLNYLDFELIKFNNKVQIADIFIYTTGDFVSSMIGKMMKEISSSFTKSDAAKVRRIKTLVQQQKYETAYRLFKELPADMQEQKYFKMMRISIVMGLDDNDLYLKILQDYKRDYPNDIGLPLIMIDAYFLSKEYDKALNAVNELDQLVGTDPLLNYHRALCYHLLEDEQHYISCLEKLYQYDPGFEDGTIELIAAYLSDKDYAKARPVMTGYRKNKSFDQARLDQYLSTLDNLPQDLLPAEEN